VARILVVYGPNLNLLGEREPHIYGRESMQQINARLAEFARREDADVEFSSPTARAPSLTACTRRARPVTQW